MSIQDQLSVHVHLFSIELQYLLKTAYLGSDEKQF